MKLEITKTNYGYAQLWKNGKLEGRLVWDKGEPYVRIVPACRLTLAEMDQIKDWYNTLIIQSLGTLAEAALG